MVQGKCARVFTALPGPYGVTRAYFPCPYQCGSCRVLGSTSACLSAVATAKDFVIHKLPTLLTATLHAIHAHAPNARVVLLGYPDLYDLSRSGTCIGLSTSDRTALDDGADALDNALQAAAAGNAIWADVRGQFAGHEICDSGSWLHSVDLLALGSSYHPTAAGQ